MAYFGEALAVALVLNGALGLVWWWWFHHIDRWEHQPLALVLTGFLWGGVAGTFAIAITGNGAMMSLYTKLFGEDWAAAWQAGLTAPFVEESAKAAGFLLLMGLASRLVRTVNDGLILGAFIGLGFQVFEDTLYATNGAAANFGTDQVHGALGTIWLRVATGFVSHPLYTALCCAGLVYLIGTVAQPRRVGRGLLFLAAGVLSHLLWDSVTGLANGGLQALLVLGGDAVLSLGVLWLAFRFAAEREHSFVRDILAPEVGTGVITDTESEALVDRHSRRALLKSGASRSARRRTRHTVSSTRDLLEAIVEARGANTPEVEHARAEVARVRNA